MTEQQYWTSAWNRRASRRNLLRTGGVLGAGLAGAALIGCADEQEAPQPTPPPGATPTPAATPAVPAEGEPRQGGHLRLAVTLVPADNFNMVTNTVEGNTNTSHHVYDTMFTPRIGRDRDASLEAAESVEIADELTIVFKLKEGLVYQDRPPVNGRPVRADDIAVLQEYVREAENAVDNSFQRAIMDSVETPDDRTVIYHLQRPYAYLFSSAAFGYPHNNGIVPSELVLGDLNTMEPVGSGPYQLKNYQFQVQYDYERNPTYREAGRGLPYIDEVTRLVMADITAREAAFRGQQLTVFGAPPPEIADRLINDLGDQITAVEYLSLAPIQSTMSSHREWTQDIRAREATYRTHNLPEFIDLILDGRGVPNLSMVQTGLEPYQLDPSETEPYRRNDPVEARQLFEAAGFDLNAERELTTIQGGGAGGTRPPSRSSRSSSVAWGSPTSPTRWHQWASSSPTSRARGTSTGASGPISRPMCPSGCCA